MGGGRLAPEKKYIRRNKIVYSHEFEFEEIQERVPRMCAKKQDQALWWLVPFALLASSIVMWPSWAPAMPWLMCSDGLQTPTGTVRSAAAQDSSHPSTGQPQALNQKLLITVVDDTGVPVPSAQLILTSTENKSVFRGETDYAGRFEFGGLAPGPYELQVQKEGFYAVTSSEPQVGVTQKVEIILNHLQELHQVMNVTDSPPAIDPEKTTESQNLSGQDIVNLPYPTTRDIRQALPLIPGVLPDASGQIHINGAATYQIFDMLDGFNITHPVSGLLDLRVSADAVRSVNVQDSRYPVEYGEGSGGVLSMITGMGDEHFRFSATNFVPSIQNRKGLNFNEWTPRATFSGPLRKGKAWFYDAVDGEYDLNIVNELPAGADRTHVWRWSNLAKAQINLTPSNILTSSFLVNEFHSPNSGLSQFIPIPSTIDQRQSALMGTVRDQVYLRSGMLLELGMSVSQFRTDDLPQSGGLPYSLRPEGATGNYFQTDHGKSRRYQWIASLTLPPVEWHGRHVFKVGTDWDRITYQQAIDRQSFSIVREDGTLSRLISFQGNPSFGIKNFEVASYAQDRWSPTDRLVLEIGIRQDWDQIIRDVLVSPRLASTYLLTRDGRTKLSLGAGLYHDATNLDFVTRQLGGERLDQAYASDGTTPLGPLILTSFHVNTQTLKAPRFLNWSAGVERELPRSVYLDLEFLQKRGTNGFAFVNPAGGILGEPSGQYLLTNIGEDRFYQVQINVKHTFRGNYPFLASFTHSVASSNAVIDFSLDNPIFAQQAGGRLPWDSPNRVLSWGGYPLLKGFDLFYSFDWRTGYPYSVVNQDQLLVGAPNTHRLPDFFSLNIHLERRFHLLGYQLALRAGFNNITNHQNASGINNNISSPGFSSLNGVQGRVFTARIRFLGKK